MSRRPAGALAGIAMILFLAAPAAARLPGPPRGVFDVPKPAVPLRDVVLKQPSAAASRIAATASAQSYPVGDGAGRVTVSVTPACAGGLHGGRPAAGRRPPRHADPRPGDRPGHRPDGHAGPARHRLRLRRPGLLLQRPGPDRDQRRPGARARRGHPRLRSRPRVRPPRRPAPPSAGAVPGGIDWGTERWASYEHVCQGQRTGPTSPATRALATTTTPARPSPSRSPSTASRTPT